MSSRLADMTALYAPMYISVSVSCLGGAFLTSNSNNAPPTTAECMSICQCVWVLLYLSPFRCLPLCVCVCVWKWCRMQAHAENALNPELEFASLISQIHTHTQIVTYLSHTHTQTLEIAKFTCVCVCVSPPSWVWAKFLSKINIWATKNVPVCGSVAFVCVSVCVCVWGGLKKFGNM